MNWLTRLWKEEDGQALTEYGLLVGLIAVACIAALIVLGPKIAGFFEKINEELDGI